MTWALARRNLRHQRRLLTALAGGVFALQLAIVLIAASFESGPGIVEIVNAMPAVLRSFLGGEVSEISMEVFVGFGFKHPAILAMLLGFTVLAATQPAAERESGLLDLLLARPVSRAGYLAATTISVAAGAVLLPLAALAGAAAGLAWVELESEPAWTQYVGSAIGQSSVILAWGGVALFFGAGANRRGSAVGPVVGVVLVAYVIDTFANTYAPFERLCALSPFHYFRPITSAREGLALIDPLVLVAVAAVMAGLAFARFARRDA